MNESPLSALKKVCMYHRSKEYYVANITGRSYDPGNAVEMDQWCLLTQGPVGPDDSFVGCSVCGPERPCFKSQFNS